MLFLFNPVEDLEQVEELCKRVYFPVEPLSMGEVTLFNGMLFVILSDVISSGEFGSFDEEQLGEMKAYQESCQSNFMAGLETYEVGGIPSYEHALALCIGVSHPDRVQVHACLLAFRWCTLSPKATRSCTRISHQLPHGIALL